MTTPKHDADAAMNRWLRQERAERRFVIDRTTRGKAIPTEAERRELQDVINDALRSGRGLERPGDPLAGDDGRDA